MFFCIYLKLLRFVKRRCHVVTEEIVFVVFNLPPGFAVLPLGLRGRFSCCIKNKRPVQDACIIVLSQFFSIN